MSYRIRAKSHLWDPKDDLPRNAQGLIVPDWKEEWLIIRGCKTKVTVESLAEFEEKLPQACLSDHGKVKRLFDSYKYSKLYLTCYPGT